jgi:glycosyltransferase involved in cell wall biosynthesis
MQATAADRVSAAGPAPGSGERFAVGLVGPLPPPAGGIANQCRQLAELLCADGVEVVVVRTNLPYRPRFVQGMRGVRAVFRLFFYLADLWRAAGRVHLLHVFANSGWVWHLVAAPAVLVGILRTVPVLVNYRGGNARTFFAEAPWWVRTTLAQADSLVVPSEFLRGVFSELGFAPRVVPNIVDLERFRPALHPSRRQVAHIVVTRNLEPIYDIPTALRAVALLRQQIPEVRVTIAGKGPELERLQRLRDSLRCKDLVRFTGAVDNARMVRLYRSADLMLNPSLVDNMPISILEAFASGVPVVSTDVGGIRFVAENERTALLVPPGDPEAMATAAYRLLADHAFAAKLRTAALHEVTRYGWSNVRPVLFEEYRRVARSKWTA